MAGATGHPGGRHPRAANGHGDVIFAAATAAGKTEAAFFDCSRLPPSALRSREFVSSTWPRSKP